jgi:hypothetical protein
MNALPSFDPPKHSQPKKSRAERAIRTTTVEPQKSAPVAPRQRVRSNNSAYAHRRQGLEAITKVVTYSTLSIVGAIALVGSIGYNYSQRGKLQHLEAELQDAKIRTEHINSNFIRSFDPQAQASVMQENSYKVAPDRLQIFLVNPNSKPATSTKQPQLAQSDR